MRALIPLVLITVTGVALAPMSTGISSGGEGTTDFAAFMEPRLVSLVGSAREVESMVSGRSRNVLALRAESDRIDTLIKEIDSYLAEHEVPTWGEASVEHYLRGKALMQTAIDSAYDALRSFDFSRMPGMIPVFSDGTDELESALRSLQSANNVGSSYTVGGVAWVGDATRSELPHPEQTAQPAGGSIC